MRRRARTGFRSHSISAGPWPSGISCSWTIAGSTPIQPRPAHKTAGLISRPPSGIVANATRRATPASRWKPGGSSVAPSCRGGAHITSRATPMASAAGRMAEAVADSLQYLTVDDTKALVAYLRRVQPQAGTPGTQIDPAPAAMIASAAWAPGSRDPKTDLGRRIFEGACASCHSWNGKGRQTDYAALAGSQAVNDPQGVNLIQVLLSGADLRTGHGTGTMPSFRTAYTDAELAAVANYVIGHFGGKAGEVTAEIVRQHRE